MSDITAGRAYKSEKTWRDAILRAVNRREGGKGSPKFIETLASRLVTEAIGGSVAALREIGDRLDGKPAQALTVEAHVGHTHTLDLDQGELARQLASMLYRADRLDGGQVIDITPESST